MHYYMDAMKWQKFWAPLTWEQRCNLELQTCQAFGEELQTHYIGFEADEKLPLNILEMLSLLKASEVAACCTTSGTVLKRRGGITMIVGLNKRYEEIAFNFLMERAGGPLDNVLVATDQGGLGLVALPEGPAGTGGLDWTYALFQCGEGPAFDYDDREPPSEPHRSSFT